MKIQKLFILLFLSILALHTDAQLSFGVKTGYVKAHQDYGDVTLPDNAPVHVHGFQIATLVYYELSPSFRIGLEPGFVQRGAACEPGFLIFNSDTKLKLNMIELPVMLQAAVPVVSDKLEVTGKLGYGFSKILSGTRKVYDLGSDAAPRIVTAEINNGGWDHGIYGGMGLALDIFGDQAFAEVSFYRGFRDFDQFNTSKNRSLQLGIGYLIRI